MTPGVQHSKIVYCVWHNFFGICDGVFSIGIFIGIGDKNAGVSTAGGETRRQGSVGVASCVKHPVSKLIQQQLFGPGPLSLL